MLLMKYFKIENIVLVSFKGRFELPNYQVSASYL